MVLMNVCPIAMILMLMIVIEDVLVNALVPLFLMLIILQINVS